MLSNFKRRILEREAATNSRHIGLRRQFNRLLIIGGMKRRFERFDHSEPPASRPRYHEPPLRPVSETGPHIFNTDSMSHLAQFMEFKDLVRPTMCRMPHIKRELEKRIIDQPDEAQRLFVEAIRGKYVEVMSCFLEARIDTEVKDDDDMTPLHIAAFHGHAASVKLLLDAGSLVKSFHGVFWSTKTRRLVVSSTSGLTVSCMKTACFKKKLGLKKPKRRANTSLIWIAIGVHSGVVQ